MKKIFLTSMISALISTTGFAVTPALQIPIPTSYQEALASRQTHQFSDNQIRSFVYYWYGLHDKHEATNKTTELLDQSHLLMIFPDMAIHNLADYQKWYDNIGQNIKSNVHVVEKLNITMLPDHRYQVDVLVDWQAVDKNGHFINKDATQQWLLVDGKSFDHPYVQEYKVLAFKDAH